MVKNLLKLYEDIMTNDNLSRRKFLRTAAVTAGVLSLNSCKAVQTGNPSKNKPNILWIYIEDMSPWIGC